MLRFGSWRCGSLLLACGLTGLWLIGAAASVRAADVEPLATSAELHKAFDDAQYTQLLPKLTRVLLLKGDPAKAYDRVDLEILRGNTYIQMKQQTSAVAAFEEAVKAINDQTPPKLASEALATRALVKHSAALAYTQRPGSDGVAHTPISLIDASQRKAAFAALFADSKADVAAKAKAAGASKSLTPIIAGINSIAELSAIETMATGADDASQDIASQLATEASTLMEDAVKTATKRVKTIGDDANKLVANPAPAVDPKASKKARQQTAATTYHKTGLNSNSTRDLNGIIDTCKKIDSVCKQFEAVAKPQAATFTKIATSADEASKEASTVLTADYSGNQTR